MVVVGVVVVKVVVVERWKEIKGKKDCLRTMDGNRWRSIIMS